jgi:hypothetical protein
MSPPLVPSLGHDDLHFVLCDFGKNGHAFVETDPAYADRNTIISNLIAGGVRAAAQRHCVQSGRRMGL